MNYKALSVMGSLHYSQLKNVEKAADYFTKSLFYSNSKYVPALVGMATLLFENSHSDKALKYLEKALDIEPLNPEVLTNFGNVLYDLKRPQEAIESY